MHAHIGGMDTFARGLKIAHAIREDGRLADFVNRISYSSFDSGIGEKVESGSCTFEDLETYALENGEPKFSQWSPRNARKFDQRIHLNCLNPIPSGI